MSPKDARNFAVLHSKRRGVVKKTQLKQILKGAIPRYDSVLKVTRLAEPKEKDQGWVIFHKLRKMRKRKATENRKTRNMENYCQSIGKTMKKNFQNSFTSQKHETSARHTLKYRITSLGDIQTFSRSSSGHKSRKVTYHVRAA